MRILPSFTPADHEGAANAVFECIDRLIKCAPQHKEDLRSRLSSLTDNCRGFISQQVPCGKTASRITELFLARIQWSREPLMMELFRSYIEAGYIDVDAPVITARSGPDGAIPLEIAILSGNLGAFEAFLRCGADVRLVPSRDWSSPRNALGKPAPITDIMSFIDAKIPIPEFAPKARTLVTEEVMRRAIASTSPDPAKAEDNPPSRRKPTV